MTVIVITGQPGSGKTAKCVDMLAFDAQFKGRPLFVGGIPDLKIEHEPVPPVTEWTEARPSPEDPTIIQHYFTFPPNAVVVIDEAQRIFRPRAASSKVPAEVQAFETHRHTGIDFVLLTQHPGLLDSNIRKLAGRHIHIAVTPMGRYSYEWTKCVDPESKTERDIAARDKYILPKRAFALYKSSELHTKIKVRLPFYIYLFAIALIILAGLSYYLYGRIFNKSESLTVSKLNGETGTKTGPMTTQEYLTAEVPRVAGLYHTAPKYDDLTKPTDAPWPSICVSVAAWRDKPASCRCLDQQGNKYQAPLGLCNQIANNGIFKDWGRAEEKRFPEKLEKPQKSESTATVAPVAVPDPV